MELFGYPVVIVSGNRPPQEIVLGDLGDLVAAVGGIELGDTILVPNQGGEKPSVQEE